MFVKPVENQNKRQLTTVEREGKKKKKSQTNPIETWRFTWTDLLALLADGQDSQGAQRGLDARRAALP